jgi:hypothetical protein
LTAKRDARFAVQSDVSARNGTLTSFREIHISFVLIAPSGVRSPGDLRIMGRQGT